MNPQKSSESYTFSSPDMAEKQMLSPVILGVDAGSTRIKAALWTGSHWFFTATSSGVSYEQDVASLIALKKTRH